MSIQIDNLGTVKIDGATAGNVADAIVNHPAQRTAIVTAIGEFVAAQVNAALSAQHGAIASLENLLDAARSNLVQQQAVIESHQAKIAELQDLRDRSIVAYESVKPGLLDLARSAGLDMQAIEMAIFPLESLLRIAKTPADQLRLEQLRQVKASREAEVARLQAEIAALEGQ